MTSDSFFNEKRKFLEVNNKFELIFIDGLHTFYASLNDVLNSLKYLSKGGFIVMHDCFPPHEAAATPAESAFEARKKHDGNWPGDWCGDVWKTIVYLKESFKNQMEISVINTDFGLGILKIKSDNLNLNFNQDLFNSINELDYDYLVQNPEKIINLKNKHLVEELI